jgi:hypothetical protein
LPNWLNLDKENISLSGTPPKDAVNQNITISVTVIETGEPSIDRRLVNLGLLNSSPLVRLKFCTVSFAELAEPG